MIRVMIAVIFFAYSFSALAMHHNPCVRPDGSHADMRDADQLLESGIFLTKHLYPYEAVVCLNEAKKLSPAYIDVRLALMNAFHDIGDKNSGMREARALARFPWMNDYYIQTYHTYLKKLNRLTTSVSHPGYTYIEVCAF